MAGYQRRFGKRASPRKSDTRERRERHLVVLGGIRTEVEYFERVAKELRATGVVLHQEALGWNPSRLIDRASELMRQDAKQAKRDGDPSNVFEGVWVIVDVDDFGDELERLMKIGLPSGIDLVISNPCFETWAVLHSERGYSAPVERSEIQKLAKSRGLISQVNGKSVVWDAWAGRFAIAEGRAAQLRLRHAAAGTKFPHDSPTTRVDEVVRTLLTAAERSTPGFSHDL